MGKKKIMVVDDELDMRVFVSTLLETSGYKPYVATHGLEGIQMAREIKPDLIILDIMLPLMDGHKLCRLIKFDKKLRKTPVIMLTSRDSDEDAQRAKEYGAEAYIIKTTRSEIILDVIHKLLDRTRKSRHG